jgi:hypothetical protein
MFLILKTMLSQLKNFSIENGFPCHARDWKMFFVPTLLLKGGLHWFWCASSARTEKPKEAIRRPLLSFGSKT